MQDGLGEKVKIHGYVGALVLTNPDYFFKYVHMIKKIETWPI